MLRREALALLLAGPGRARPAAAGNLDRFVGSAGTAAALLVDVRERRLIGVAGTAAGRMLVAPGSSVKPLVLAALLRSGKLRAEEAFLCSGHLTIGKHTLDCSHPRMDLPMRVDTALAYSCNGFVAHAAERFGPGELVRELEHTGISSRTGWFDNEEATGRIRRADSLDARRLQAIGEESILVTAAGLAMAYCNLARRAGDPEMQPIVAGMEGAVEFGTAQRAQVAGVKVAGKTGSAPGRVAWFAGFLPSRAPEVVVAVTAAGYSGGADAAPIGGRILEAYRQGRL